MLLETNEDMQELNNKTTGCTAMTSYQRKINPHVIRNLGCIRSQDSVVRKVTRLCTQQYKV
jgi:hypothetical protein